jgi:acyl-homoserine lactone acylase PvdQ
MLLQLAKEPHLHKYNRFCENAFSEYKGDASCAYNVARALIDTKQYLEWHVSKNPSDWVWKHFHQN